MLLSKKNILILSLVIFCFIFVGALASYIFHDQGLEDTDQELEEVEESIDPDVPEEVEESEEEVDIFDEPPMEESPEDEDEFVE